MRECLRTGLYTHQQVMDLSLREVVEVLDAARWRRRQTEKQSIATAWHAAAFISMAKAGKLEGLNAYFNDDEEAAGGDEAPEMSPEQEELVWTLVLGPGPATPETVN